MRNHTGIVADASTCRRHCESKHAVNPTHFWKRDARSLPAQGKYRNWCKKTGFESKLAGDIAARKLKLEQSQRTIDSYLVEKNFPDGTASYSDDLFQQAAIEWLVATDQVSLDMHFGLAMVLLMLCSRLTRLNIRSSRK
jgi:hypothetical protein